MMTLHQIKKVGPKERQFLLELRGLLLQLLQDLDALDRAARQQQTNTNPCEGLDPIACLGEVCGDLDQRTCLLSQFNITLKGEWTSEQIAVVYESVALQH
jgi:hypothetical protein